MEKQREYAQYSKAIAKDLWLNVRDSGFRRRVFWSSIPTVVLGGISYPVTKITYDLITAQNQYVWQNPALPILGVFVGVPYSLVLIGTTKLWLRAQCQIISDYYKTPNLTELRRGKLEGKAELSN